VRYRTEQGVIGGGIENHGADAYRRMCANAPTCLAFQSSMAMPALNHGGTPAKLSGGECGFTA
jgi:hypothetical protein